MMLKLLVALALVESVALAVNVKLPTLVGTPEIEPAEFIDRPAGRLPESTAHA